MSKNLAVLIDGENISHRHFPQIREILSNMGEIVVQRVYADWSVPNVSGWKPVISQHALAPVHQPQIGKNSTDSALIMDAIELLRELPQIDTYCVVSSDSDFCALCLRLRNRGKTVIGFGVGHSSSDLRKSCHSFHVVGRDSQRSSNIIEIERKFKKIVNFPLINQA